MREAQTGVSALRLQLLQCSSGDQKPFRHPAILSMIASCLIRPAKGSDMPVINLFPEQYMTIPDILVTSSCAYVCSCVGNKTSTLTSLSDHMCFMYLIPWLLWGHP